VEKKGKHGGVRKGAGRPSKVDEDKSRYLIKEALRRIYKKDEDDENTILFLHDFAQTPKGQQFVAEHLLGKPKEKVESTVNIQSIAPIEWTE